ncbi:hypothetical protein [uncultured Pseudacidovorax sp.]|uniref:hypothetical protein n=1 Tax=uncultured Pseudacidovorax sp. TaxID=679313 RepID=UPI0025E443EE|nr:hypothetical protein [uncultured Pseudacidovorax sp.]
MKPFALTPDMLSTLGNTFYPTGHTMLVFADEAAAREAAQALAEGGVPGDDVAFVSPEAITNQIGPTTSDADNPLPSPGTEGATVRAYVRLAQEGHAGLLVRTETDEEMERLRTLLRDKPPAMGQRYRTLVIEDL